MVGLVVMLDSTVPLIFLWLACLRPMPARQLHSRLSFSREVSHEVVISMAEPSARILFRFSQLPGSGPPIFCLSSSASISGQGI